MTSIEIIASLKEKNGKAFDYIFRKYASSCIRKLKSKGCCQEDAEDLFTDAVLVLREKVIREEVKVLTNVSSYLFSICFNTFLAVNKKKVSQKLKEREVSFHLYEDNSYMDNLGLMNVSKKAFSQLTERCKDILYYFYVDKLRMDQIAEIMGFASGDVAKTSKSRCYKNFVDQAKKFMNEIKEENAK